MGQGHRSGRIWNADPLIPAPAFARSWSCRCGKFSCLALVQSRHDFVAENYYYFFVLVRDDPKSAFVCALPNLASCSSGR